MLEMKDCFIWDHSFDNNSFIRWNRWRLDEKGKKIEIICHPSSSSVFLDIARWVFSLWHKSPAWQGQRSVQIDFAKNKCILSCTQIFLCKYKQGLATNWKTSGLWNKRTNPFLSSHPNSTAEFIGGFATWAVIQILICSEDRKTCWVKVASQGEDWLNMHPSVSLTLPLIC